jgi:predicted ATP-dependent endonuclease of OLD family
MILKKFKIENYKSIIKTEWIEIDKLTVFVGKNEAGKTTILKALHKLNPHSPEPFTINEDWPRGNRKGRSLDNIVVSTIFETSNEIIKCEHIPDNVDRFLVTIEKDYNNELFISLTDDWFLKLEEDQKTELLTTIEKALPTFIYMSDYRNFKGGGKLNEILARKQQSQNTEEDNTIMTLLELSGLNLEEEVTKGNQTDREQRQYDLNDASLTLTKELEDRWKQKKYEIEFKADGQEFYTFIKDEKKPILVKLEERSKGFQWFFSFDLMFMYESKGSFENCIILLDEPGLHLHPDGQKDLLDRLKNYSKDNVLLYSSHLPFMIDLNNPSSLRIVTESDKGTIITDELVGTDPESKFVLQAALGMSGSTSYLVAQKNLVVEGVDDYWLLTEISNTLTKNGREGLNSEIFITPAGGASEVVYISTIMIGQKLDVFSLFDEDDAGRIAKDKLINNWLLKFNNTTSKAMTISELLEIKNDFAIEDLLTEKFYLGKVKDAYPKLSKEKIELIGSDLLVKRIERSFKNYEVHFNKGSVANLIRKELINSDITYLPKETIDNAEKLFKKINEILK